MSEEITFEDLSKDPGIKGFTDDEALDFINYFYSEMLVDIGALIYQNGKYHQAY